MEIPKGLLLIPRDKADQVIGHPVSARTGIGALLANNLIKIINDSHAYRESDSLRIATVLVDLASALFAHVLETDGDLEPESWQRTLILRIRDFIDRHLHDPDLNPGAIADAHHISVSYLHRLFQADDGVTVATWIRQQRLERARRVLEDPCLRGVPVHQIATRCGFTDHSVFTRAFRIAFGLPPSEHRHQTLCTPGRLHNATTTGRINGSELPGSERVLGAGAAERVGVGHDQTDDKTGPGGAGVFGAGRAKRGLGPAGTILQEQLSHGGGRPSSEAAP
jgi:AraC-like DNA-binding protein